MKKKNCKILTATLFCLLASCASKGPVSNGMWGAKEVREVCTNLVENCLDNPRVAASIRAKKHAPVVIVGDFPNQTSEYIDTSIVAEQMETAIINDGRLRFVADGSVRKNLRAERQDQQSNASEATAKTLGNETGADYMLNGSVKSIVTKSNDGKRQSRTYYVYAQLTNIETNEILWKGNDEVSIESKVSSVRF